MDVMPDCADKRPVGEPQSDTAPIADIAGVSFWYEGYTEPVLEDVNLSVRPGEFVLLTGPSGCGKTTLARCLNGLIPHLIFGRLTGSVTVGGLNVAEHPVSRLAAVVGMVFQVPEAQLFNLTVEEEVAFGCRNLGMAHGEVSRCVDWALDVVGMQQVRGRDLHKLSGGEKQLVAIASVLATHPKVMVLDEPLSNLDARGAARVLEVLGWLRRESGMAVVMVEHRTNRVDGVAGRVVVMDRGRIVLDGGPDILQREKDYLTGLGVRVRGAGEKRPPVEPGPLGPVVVSVEDVRFGYNGHEVLKGISMEMRRGEFVALVGDSGAGKSTLAHLIAGALRPKSGTVRVAGTGKGGQKVGLLLQNPSEQLFCDTVEEEVRFGLENFGLADSGVVDEMLALTDLAHMRNHPVQNLSRGQQQRLSLAAVLALRPEILLLDEPTLGQDWGHMRRFMDFVKGLQRAGTTVLLITHDRDVAELYADRTVRLVDGRAIG